MGKEGVAPLSVENALLATDWPHRDGNVIGWASNFWLK